MENQIEKAKAWWMRQTSETLFRVHKLYYPEISYNQKLTDEQILHIYLSETQNETSSRHQENETPVNHLKDFKNQLHEHCDDSCFCHCSKGGQQAPECLTPVNEPCFLKCESCGNDFDIETMIEGEQWFCKPCFDELSQVDEFMGRTPVNEVEEVTCNGCYAYIKSGKPCLKSCVTNEVESVEEAARRLLVHTLTQHNSSRSQVYWFQFNESETKLFVDMILQFHVKHSQFLQSQITELRDLLRSEIDTASDDQDNAEQRPVMKFYEGKEKGLRVALDFIEQLLAKHQ